jgi:hypothetical protein
VTARITGIDPTGSAFDRTARCAPSAALPQVFDANESSARDRGTAIHKYLERVAEHRKAGTEDPRAAALGEVDDEWRQTCNDVDLVELTSHLTLSTEVAVAYNWREDTARILFPVEPRIYEIDPDCEIAMTLDLVGAGDRVVYVGDYKGPYAWLPEPEQSLQLGVGALAVARIFKGRSAVVEYIRIRSDGTTRKFRGELDVFALEALAERVHRMMTDVHELRGAIAAGVTPNVTEGPYCRYCPARQHCPAKTALIRSVLADPAPISLREPITPANAAGVYAIVRKAKDAIAMVDAALYAYAKTERIPLGVDADGSLRFFGELRRPGNEVLDGATVHRVLAERYGGEAANAAVTMETTKKAIGDVARKHLGPDEKITKVVEAIVDQVRELGGATRKETCTTVEFTEAPDGQAKVRKRKSA